MPNKYFKLSFQSKMLGEIVEYDFPYSRAATEEARTLQKAGYQHIQLKRITNENNIFFNI